MSRVLPHPLLSVGLGLMWLLLNAPLEPATALLAALVALVVPVVLRALKPKPIRVRAPATILRLGAVVLYDMLRSNVDVARIVLGLHGGTRRAGYVSIPLDLRNDIALTILAIILTGTPGTLWVQYDSHTGRLLLHVLDLTDGEAWIRRVKDRYERPLLEIFP